MVLFILGRLSTDDFNASTAAFAVLAEVPIFAIASATFTALLAMVWNADADFVPNCDIALNALLAAVCIALFIVVAAETAAPFIPLNVVREVLSSLIIICIISFIACMNDIPISVDTVAAIVLIVPNTSAALPIIESIT